MRHLRSRIYLYPDDVGSGAGPAEPAAETTGAEVQATPEVQETPAYFSQFRKENRERFSSLGKYRSLDELADAALRADQVKEPDYTGWLKIPTGESSKEEIKDFLGKLGVPEGPEKYTIPTEEDGTMKAVEDVMRKAAYRAGLTDSQAKAMWGVLHAVTDTASQSVQAHQKERVEGFDKRYEELFLQEYQDPSRAKAAVKESQGYFRTFLADTGLAGILKETGAIYDERLVKALADYQKRNRGAYHSGAQTPQEPKPTTKMTYSDDFYRQYGGKE